MPIGMYRSFCGRRTGFWDCQNILAFVTYVLILVSYHLVISDVRWPGYLGVETSSCVTELLQISFMSNTFCGVERDMHTSYLLPWLQNLYWQAYTLCCLQKIRQAADILTCIQWIFWEALRLLCLQKSSQSIHMHASVSLQEGLILISETCIKEYQQ